MIVYILVSFHRKLQIHTYTGSFTGKHLKDLILFINIEEEALNYMDLFYVFYSIPFNNMSVLLQTILESKNMFILFFLFVCFFTMTMQQDNASHII